MLKIAGPFLVVVPLSTVPNWIKEFRKWTPQLNALVYVGDSKSRDVIRNYEFFNHKGAARPYRFEVLVDSPQARCASLMLKLSLQSASAHVSLACCVPAVAEVSLAAACCVPAVAFAAASAHESGLAVCLQLLKLPVQLPLLGTLHACCSQKPLTCL